MKIILDRYIEYLIYTMILFIPISISGVEICAGLSLGLFLLSKSFKLNFKFFDNNTHFFLLLFFLFCGLSLLNSGFYLNKSLHALFAKWGKYILILFMIEDTLNTPKRIRTAVFILLAVSIFINLDGVFQIFKGKDFLYHYPLVGNRIRAFFYSANGYAAYSASILLLFIPLLFQSHPNRYLVYILSFGAVLSFACLIMAFSRGAYLGFIAGLSLMLFSSRKIKPFLILMLFIAIIVIFIPQLKEIFTNLFHRVYPGFIRRTERAPIVLAAWRMIMENPFLGKGLGTFMDYSKNYSSTTQIIYAHNCFLQIWAETGIFSLVSFSGFLISLIFEGVKSFRNNQDFVILGLTCAIFSFAIHSLFDVHFYSLQLAVLFWSLAGILLASINNKRRIRNAGI
jgi:O-antigen ligase